MEAVPMMTPFRYLRFKLKEYEQNNKISRKTNKLTWIQTKVKKLCENNDIFNPLWMWKYLPILTNDNKTERRII